MGTFVEIGVKVGCGYAHSVITEAFGAMERVQRLLSFQDPGSDLSKLNRSCGSEVTLHPLSARVLQLALKVTRASGGLFNCTVGGALVRQGMLPDHGGPLPLDYGVADDVHLHGQHVQLRRPVRITLDGIAKGYAVDCAVKILKRYGVAAGWVNAGGDLRVFGDMVLSVQRREINGDFTPLGGLCSAAIATSWVKPGHDSRFPGFIVAGDAGMPTQGVWSVLARSAWQADALTKVASLAPQANRADLVRQLGGRWVAPA
jgi:thiamine biosynthesis lipoprotein